jgi:hypothetical protein
LRYRAGGHPAEGEVINLLIADYQFIRNYILRLTSEADLNVESTLRELMDSIPPDDWSSVEELVDVGNFTEETTILELLAGIQSADVSPDND